MSDLEFRVEPSDGATVRVTVAGTVDFAVGDQLFDALVAIMAADDVRDVEVDVAGVELLDASAVGVLLAARNRAGTVGVGFRVLGATGLPRQVLEITGVLGLLGAKS
jgi:anti-anti-sigma factor